MLFWKWIKKETRELLPPLVFFFFAFNFINITEGMMIKKMGLQPFSFVTILIGAGIVAKVFLVVDLLPIINAFPKRPLIYNVIWKTLLYGTATLIVRLLTRFIPLYWENAGIGYENLISIIDWSQFWGIQFWFYLLFFTFVAARELILAVGPGKVKRLFFGK